MATEIERPAAVVSGPTGGTPWVTNPPASDIAAWLSDDNLTSYMDKDYPAGGTTGSTTVVVSIGNPTVPALAQIRGVQARINADSIYGSMRVALVDAAAAELATYLGGAGSMEYQGTVFATRWDGGAWTAADANDLRLLIAAGSNSITHAHRVKEAYVDFLINEAPVVDVTAPTSPATVSAPTITWTYTDPEGDLQERYEVIVWDATDYNAAGFDVDAVYNPGLGGYFWGSAYHQPAWRSGNIGSATGEVLSAATSVVCGADLLDGHTYRAFVRAVDVGSSGRWGARDYIEFTMVLTAPDAPTVTVVDDEANARMIVSLVADGGAPSTEYFVVERSLDGGLTWQAVRGGEQVTNPASGTTTVTFYDYDAPFELATSYRARGVDTGTGPAIAGPWSAASNSATLVGGCDTWLKSSSDPTLNVAFTTNPMQDSELQATGAVFTPQGRQYPIVHLGTQHAEVFAGVVFNLPDDEAYAALLALWALRETLLIQLPYGDIDGYEQHWVRLPSPLAITRLSVDSMHDAQPRRLVVPMVEVAEPG